MKFTPLPVALLALLVLVPGCGNDREITFSSEVTEEEQRELDAREATFEANLAAARAARAARRAGGSGDADGSRAARHVVLAAPEIGSPAQHRLHLALEDLLAGMPNVSYQRLDAEADPDLQLRQLHELATAPPDVLLVAPVAANELAVPVETLLDLGTRVIALEHVLPGCQPTATLRLDLEGIGRAVGQFAVAALRRKEQEQNLPDLGGRIVVIRGNETGEHCRLIQRGFTEVLRDHPRVRIVHDAPGFWNPSETAQRFRDAVRLQQEFDIVFAHHNLMARAARDAAREHEMLQQLLFIGLGTASSRPGSTELVRDGLLGASIERADLAEQAVDLTLRMLEEPSWRPEPALRELSWRLVTGESLAIEGAIGTP